MYKYAIGKYMAVSMAIIPSSMRDLQIIRGQSSVPGGVINCHEDGNQWTSRLPIADGKQIIIDYTNGTVPGNHYNNSWNLF